MGERAYTVAEIDALRDVCDHKWLYGTYPEPYKEPTAEELAEAERQWREGGCIVSGTSQMSRTYNEVERVKCVEELVRTHMLAGHTAEDLVGRAAA